MLNELKELSEEIVRVRKEMKSLGLSVETFTVYWILKKKGVERALDFKDKIEEIFNEHKLWKVNKNEGRKLKIELIKLFLNLLESKRIREVTETVNKILEILR
jgi:type I restriction enzyme R subunit